MLFRSCMALAMKFFLPTMLQVTVVLFPAGWKGICTVHDTMRNVYMLS